MEATLPRRGATGATFGTTKKDLRFLELALILVNLYIGLFVSWEGNGTGTGTCTSAGRGRGHGGGNPPSAPSADVAAAGRGLAIVSDMCDHLAATGADIAAAGRGLAIASGMCDHLAAIAAAAHCSTAGLA